MDERRLTRRSVLKAGAGALAGSLARPGGALAALAGPPRPRLSEHPLGTLQGGRVRTISLPTPADLVGLQWRAPEGGPRDGPGLQLRFATAAGTWTRWVPAEGHGHGPEGTPPEGPPGASVGDPIWTGGTTAVQVLSRGRASDVVAHLVDVSGGIGARRRAASLASLASGGLPLVTPALQAGPGQPPIIARRAWALGSSPPRVAPGYGQVRMAFVHHTDSPNGYTAGEVPAMVQAIYLFHRDVNGWNDIGYNFLIDLYGRIFEARAGGIEEPVTGAHAGGFNLVSTGVAVLGTFMSTSITPAAALALQGLLAWKLSLHGVPAIGTVTVKVNPAGASYSRFPANARVRLPHIAGHRDGDSTDCPGDVLYGELPAIRSRALALSPRPNRLTLTLAAASPAGPPAAGGPPGGGGPALEGSLNRLDGAPIPGAGILIQQRLVSRRGEVVQERTIAEATSDGRGAFSVPGGFSAAASRGLALRALYEGSGGTGACVSPPLPVTLGAPSSPSGAPAPTPGASRSPAG